MIFDERSSDRIKDTVRRSEAGDGIHAKNGLAPLAVEPVWILTTSGTATSGYYPGVVSLKNGDGTWTDLTATVRVQGANLETLASATRYGCRPSGPNASGESTFTLLGGVSTGGGGSLTVTDFTDGTPTITGVTTLQVTSATGVDILAGSTPNARIGGLAASLTQMGMVTTANQQFDGQKSFRGTVEIGGLGGGIGELHFGWSPSLLTWKTTLYSNSTGLEIGGGSGGGGALAGVIRFAAPNDGVSEGSSVMCCYSGAAGTPTAMAYLSLTASGASVEADFGTGKNAQLSASSAGGLVIIDGNSGASVGTSHIIPLAKVTTSGSGGSITVRGGAIIAYTDPT